MTLDLVWRAGSPPGHVPVAPFRRLSTLWVQITGTWCNLACTHCLNASGPRDPWLRPMGAEAVERAIEEARALGVREIYFTGGEPFLHGRIVPLLRLALRVAPTTVLTNGAAVDDAMADRLLALAEESPYSLEVRVSVDDPDPERNDRIRGPGAWAAALGAIRRLDGRGLLPIVTATAILREETPGEGSLYERLHDLLRSIGVSRPRVKILPVFGDGSPRRCWRGSTGPSSSARRAGS